jgi:hypothetical protein
MDAEKARREAHCGQSHDSTSRVVTSALDGSGDHGKTSNTSTVRKARQPQEPSANPADHKSSRR